MIITKLIKIKTSNFGFLYLKLIFLMIYDFYLTKSFNSSKKSNFLKKFHQILKIFQNFKNFQNFSQIVCLFYAILIISGYINKFNFKNTKICEKKWKIFQNLENFRNFEKFSNLPKKKNPFFFISKKIFFKKFLKIFF